MVEVYVWLAGDDSKCESIWVPENSTKEYVTQKVNEKYGDNGWRYYDICPMDK